MEMALADFRRGPLSGTKVVQIEESPFYCLLNFSVIPPGFRVGRHGDKSLR